MSSTLKCQFSENHENENDTCAWTPNKIKGNSWAWPPWRRAHLSTGASREAPVDNGCFSWIFIDFGDRKSWIPGYWQLAGGLGKSRQIYASRRRLEILKVMLAMLSLDMLYYVMCFPNQPVTSDPKRVTCHRFCFVML